MRKTILSIMFLLILLLVPSIAFAAEGNVAEVGNTEYATLEEAVENAGTETITLLNNTELEAVLNISGNVTLDLNGFSITPVSTLKSTTGIIIVHNGATLTINDAKGTGKISGGVENDNLYAAITLTHKGTYDEGKTAKLIVNGGTLEGYYYGVSGNGSRHNTEITVNGGTIKGATSVGSGIFHPQTGVLTVNEGTIEGAAGIEMRAGELVVNGGTIIGDAVPVTVNPNGSGTTSVGAGIAVAQHTTKLPTSVVVNGGTIQGYSAVYESNPQENEAEAIEKVSMEINGGNFETINNGTAVVCSDSKKLVIAGGTFNKELDETYLAEGVTAEDENGKIVVGTRYDVVVNTTTNGTVTTSLERAREGQTIQLTTTPANGYQLSKLTVLNADNNEVEVVDGAFTMPAGGVTVTAEFEKIPEPEPEPEPTPETGDVDFIVPEDNEGTSTGIGVVESETVKETLDTSLKADTKLNEKVEEARKNGETVKVEIKMEALEKDNVKVEEKQKILQTVKANQTVHQYFDISVLVTANQSGELGKITQLTEKMKFSIEISKDLIQEGRKFYIIKLHGDEVKRIEAVLNGTKLEFETDQFSTFALAYEDVESSDVAPEVGESDDLPATGEKDDTPKTGAINVFTYVWIALAVIALVGIVTTKKPSKHSK